MNPTIYESQSNTQPGAIQVLAAANLTGQEGRLVVMSNNSGTAEVGLPAAATDRAEYLLLEGAPAGKFATVVAVDRGRNWRVRLTGTANPGQELTLATGAAAGAVRTVPADAGDYYVFLRAEEAGVDGQLLLVRPILNARDVTVTE